MLAIIYKDAENAGEEIAEQKAAEQSAEGAHEGGCGRDEMDIKDPVDQPETDRSSNYTAETADYHQDGFEAGCD